jgi:hypothetical protein
MVKSHFVVDGERESMREHPVKSKHFAVNASKKRE